MHSHLARNHASEPAVAEILKLPLNKMCAEYRKLTRLGNFRYNLGVLKSGNKNLLVTVVRRPSNNETEFLPCPACYGFYQKKFLWGHHIGCSWRLEGKQTGTQNGNENYVKSVLAESQCMLGVLTQPTCRLAREKILPAMDKRDAVFHALSMDPLILVFGSLLYRKLGRGRNHDIQQRMRQLARLVMASGMNLSTLMKPENFESLISAVHKEWGHFTDNQGMACYASPEVVLRIGHSLQRCANFKIGAAVRVKDDAARKEGEEFLKLMTYEWADRVSTVALNSLKVIRFNEALLLPLTIDMHWLAVYLDKQMDHLIVSMKQVGSYSLWRQLSQLCMTRMILFSGRRHGEVDKLKVREYEERLRCEDTMNDEVKKGLSALEKQLLKRYFSTKSIIMKRTNELLLIISLTHTEK